MQPFSTKLTPQHEQIREIHISALNDREYVVYRIRDAESNQIDGFVKNYQELLGKNYNLIRMYITVFKWTLEKQLNFGRFMLPSSKRRGSMLCTDAVLVNLFKACPHIEQEASCMQPRLDFYKSGEASFNDLVRLKNAGVFVQVSRSSSAYSRATAQSEHKPTMSAFESAWESTGRRRISVRTFFFTVTMLFWFKRQSLAIKILALLACAMAATRLTNSKVWARL